MHYSVFPGGVDEPFFVTKSKYAGISWSAAVSPLFLHIIEETAILSAMTPFFLEFRCVLDFRKNGSSAPCSLTHAFFKHTFLQHTSKLLNTVESCPFALQKNKKYFLDFFSLLSNWGKIAQKSFLTFNIL